MWSRSMVSRLGRSLVGETASVADRMPGSISRMLSVSRMTARSRTQKRGRNAFTPPPFGVALATGA